MDLDQTWMNATADDFAKYALSNIQAGSTEQGEINAILALVKAVQSLDATITHFSTKD